MFETRHSVGSSPSSKPGRAAFSANYRRILQGLKHLARQPHAGEMALGLSGASLARALIGQFAVEEEYLLWRLKVVDASEAARLKAEHDALRSLLEPLVGEDGKADALPSAESLNRIVAALDAHVAREEITLFRWAESRVLGWVWAKAARALQSH